MVALRDTRTTWIVYALVLALLAVEAYTAALPAKQ